MYVCGAAELGPAPLARLCGSSGSVCALCPVNPTAFPATYCWDQDIRATRQPNVSVDMAQMGKRGLTLRLRQKKHCVRRPELNFGKGSVEVILECDREGFAMLN